MGKEKYIYKSKTLPTKLLGAVQTKTWSSRDLSLPSSIRQGWVNNRLGDKHVSVLKTVSWLRKGQSLRLMIGWRGRGSGQQDLQEKAHLPRKMGIWPQPSSSVATRRLSMWNDGTEWNRRSQGRERLESPEPELRTLKDVGWSWSKDQEDERPGNFWVQGLYPKSMGEPWRP